MTTKNLSINITISLMCAFFAGAGLAQNTEREGLTYDSNGRRDPFIPLITHSVKVSAGLENVQSADDIMLEGIVWDTGGGSIAILNGVIVKEGDEIGSVAIETINETNVILYINKVKNNIALGEEGEKGEE